MPKHKLEKKSQFTQLDNQLIRNPELSSMEKVVLGIGLSVADGWKYNVNGLARYCKEGTDAVKAALRGLEEKGYVTRRRIRENGRFLKMEYHFFENPVLNPGYGKVGQSERTEPSEKKSAVEAPPEKLPSVDLPPVVNPQVKKINQKNTYINNKDYTNTLSINQYPSIEAQIKAQIEYDAICERYDRRLLDNIVSVMVDVMLSESRTMRLGKDNSYATDYVQGCMKKINPFHIEQIFDSLEKVKPKICNTKAYLLVSLINAVGTMDLAYQYGDY